MRRIRVNKYSSAAKFRSRAKLTKAANVKATPMRGGWRL